MSQEALEFLARRYVWWQEADRTLEFPDVLLRQILRLGTADDYIAARDHWGENALKHALITSPPGAIDDRSREFWYRLYDLRSAPPPRRSFS